MSTRPVRTRRKNNDPGGIDRQFFPYKQNFSLVATTHRKKRRSDPLFFGWETENFPTNDSLRAIEQWFRFVSGPSGVLEILARCARSADCSDFVRDAWRLIRRLKARGKTSIPEAEQDKPFSPHEARCELIRLHEQLDGSGPPLSRVARIVRDMIYALAEGKGITGKEIIKQLSRQRITTDQSTLTTHIIPQLKKYWRIKNRPGVGYYRELTKSK